MNAEINAFRIKWAFRFFVGLLALCLACSPKNQSNEDSSPPHDLTSEILLTKIEDLDDPHVFVVAHRSDWRYAPENSIEGILHCIEDNVDILEVDVSKTRDGQYILMHDKTLDRTSTGKGKVADWTLDSLNRLRLLNGMQYPTASKIPTLDEVLEICKGKALLKLDKSIGHIPEIFQLLKARDMQNYAFFYGTQTYQQLKKEIGKYVDSIQYIPQVNSENASSEFISDFIKNMQPKIFEFHLPSIQAEHAQYFDEVLPHARIFIVTTGIPWGPEEYTDVGAFADPEGNWGGIIAEGITVIGTDSPFRLLDFLRSKHLHSSY